MRRSARPAWVTRAEAAFVARVAVEEIDRRIAAGMLVHRRVGGVVLVEPSGLTRPDSPPVEARSVRAARARPGWALPGSAVVVAVAGLATIALVVGLLTTSSGSVQTQTIDAGAAPIIASTPTPGSMAVGRDPFASPFTAQSKGDQRGAILVKPPGVVRDGDAITAAATVVNRSGERWLPPSEVTFVARDGTGGVLARKTTKVSLGPGRAETVVAPDLAVQPAAIAAIEAHIDPTPLRSGRFRPASVSVADAEVREGGKAIQGTLTVGRGSGRSAHLSCAIFDHLGELVGVGTTSVDLSSSHARTGRMRFWLPANPTGPGPYRVSCSAS